jgi:hypothetical protein
MRSSSTTIKRPPTSIHGGVHSLRSTGLDWTQKYPAMAVATIEAQKAYHDGGLCGVSPDDITSSAVAL